MKVLHGVTGAAGQPNTLARYQRQLGVHAESVMIGESSLAFAADRRIDVGVDTLNSYSSFLAEAIREFDVFHFYFRPLFFFDPVRPAFPTAIDLLLLRACDKTVIFHYRGSEVRTAQKFRHFSPYNYVDEDPSRIFTKFPEHSVDTLSGFVKAVANAVLVPDEELQSYVPHARIVRRAVPLEELLPQYSTGRDRPLILHAPTRPIVKGTPHVLEAVRRLRELNYDFDFELVENRPHEEALDLYRRADIVIDQLRIGWYGVLAVEAMALGKAVIAYVRDDLVHHLGAEPPLAVANPDTLLSTLRRLLDSPEEVRALGRRGRRFVEEQHDALSVAQELLELYRSDAVQKHQVDESAALDFVQAQFRYTKSAVKDGRFAGHRHTGPTSWEKFRYVKTNSGLRVAIAKAVRAVQGR